MITALDPDLDFVLADPGHIEQILINLAVNARDVLSGGGMLIIETRNFNVDAAYATTCANLSAGRYISLDVRDNGPGMPPEVIDRAFEPFYTTKPKGEGTGLGLATVYGIVAQPKGNVRITSEPGHGTAVTVLLPVTDRASAAEPDFRREPERGRGERVLVVEDEPAMREVTRRILVHNGYQVIAVASGQEAIHAAESCHDGIAALITDVRMPGMQGKEVAERVRELQPGIAVLFMSGYTRELLSAQGILEPGISLIEKPFSKTSLLEEVSELLPGTHRPGTAGPCGENIAQGYFPDARQACGSVLAAESGWRQHGRFLLWLDLPVRRRLAQSPPDDHRTHRQPANAPSDLGPSCVRLPK